MGPGGGGERLKLVCESPPKHPENTRTPWCSGSGTRARRSRGSGSCFGTRDEPNRGLILITTTEFYKTSEGSLAAFPPTVLNQTARIKNTGPYVLSGSMKPPCVTTRRRNGGLP